jgi:hypothetical protein
MRAGRLLAVAGITSVLLVAAPIVMSFNRKSKD